MNGVHVMPRDANLPPHQRCGPPGKTKLVARNIRRATMTALPPKADMCGALAHVCFGPKADSCTAQKEDRLAAVSLKFDQFSDYAAACAFLFLLQPSRPNALRPVAKSGRAAGSGVTVVSPKFSSRLASENAATV